MLLALSLGCLLGVIVAVQPDRSAADFRPTADDFEGHAARLEALGTVAACVAEGWTPRGEAAHWRLAARAMREVCTRAAPNVVTDLYGTVLNTGD